MDFNTAMNAYLQDLQDLQEEKKSKFDQLVEQRAFSLLVLENQRASVRRVEDDIARIDKEILTLTDQKQKIGKSRVNRAAVIDLAEMMSIMALFSLINSLEDEKRQLEKNPNKAAEEIQICTDKIEIYREVYQRRMRCPIVNPK
jgi:DNA repair exonuclease SbcCD ATPase subunit